MGNVDEVVICKIGMYTKNRYAFWHGKEENHPMTISQMRDTLIRVAFAGCILAFVYLFFEYLLPIVFPFIVGFLVAYGVVQLAEHIRPNCRWLRLLLIVVIYGGVGVVLVIVTLKGISAGSGFVAWLPQFYESNLAPLGEKIHDGFDCIVKQLDPSLGSTVEVLSGSLRSAFNNFFAALSGFAVNLLSGIVTAVPAGVVSVLAMIICTFFVASDYEKIMEFLTTYTPPRGKKRLLDVRRFLTNTLFVVMRSYLLIMLLTFTELSVLFFLFGISSPLTKAALIAVFDILPILGTGGILIPWSIGSMILGNPMMGVKLLIIYAIVMVVRNYVEPKIVGVQLGLHPIITLVSMFVGLRMFGFWGMLGLPVAIAYFWKCKKEHDLEAREVESSN